MIKNDKKKVYILNKSILANIANDGCKKRAIKTMITTIENRNKKTKGRESYNFHNIGEKLNIKGIPARNIVPLVKYQESAKSAELASIYKLLNEDKNIIYTEKQSKAPDPNDNIHYEPYIFNKENKELLKQSYTTSLSKLFNIDDDDAIALDEEIKNDKNIIYKIDNITVKDDTNKSKFEDIADPEKYNYLYQLRYEIHNIIEVISKLAPEKKEFYKENSIELEAFIPDFIKIMPKDSFRENGMNYKVLNEQFNIIESKNDKTKLAICDVKMSDYRDSFSTELAVYMVTLQQFLNENRLNNRYEVLASGFILNESLSELLTLDESILDCKEIFFENTKNNIEALFISKLPEIIDIIKGRDIEKYNSVIMTPACSTCDYYGGYLAGRLERDGKTVKLTNLNTQQRLAEIDCISNDFCTIIERKNETINVIPSLKTSDKDILIKNDCLKYSDITNRKIDDLQANISLFAKKNKITKEVNLKLEDKQNRKRNTTFAEKTANASKIITGAHRATINFYLDAKYDSQNIGLCFGYAYEYIDGFGNKPKRYYDNDNKNFCINENSKGWTGYPTLNYSEKGSPKNIIKGKSNVNVVVIDKLKYERYYFLRLLIDINEVISYYEKVMDKDDIRIAFYYWNNKSIDYFRRLFMEMLSIIVPKYKEHSNDIDISDVKKVCYHYATKDFISHLKKVYYRLRGMLTVEKRDQIYLADRVLFCLKNAIEDTYVLNSDFNNTMYEVHRNCNYVDGKLIKDNFKNISLFKRFTDEIHGGVLPKLHKDNQSRNDRLNYEIKIKNMLECRLYTMAEIRHAVNNSSISIEPRTIPSMVSTKSLDNSYLANTLYLYSKLQVYADKEKIENIHAQETHQKIVLGNSIKLSYEITGVKRQELLKDEANNPKLKIYQIDDSSVFADYKEGDYCLVLYPQDRLEYIYKTISCNSKYKNNTIFIDDIELQTKIKTTVFKNKKWLEPMIDDDPSLKNLVFRYRTIMNRLISIKSFNRQKKYIILKIKDLGLDIIEYLTNDPLLNFDFTKNLILEKEHIDFWLPKLKQCMEEYIKNADARWLFEDYTPITIKDSIEDEMNKIKSLLNIDIEDCKLEAIAFAMLQRLSILWGPPGTGKTFTISLLIIYYILQNIKDKKRILLVGNYTPTYNIIKEIMGLSDDYQQLGDIRKYVDIKRIISDEKREDENLGGVDYINPYSPTGTIDALEIKNKANIISITPNQIYSFFVKGTKKNKATKVLLEELENNGFDFIIVDEGSQMEIGKFIPAIIRATQNTTILIAGDPKQLQPVLKVKIKDTEENIFGSILDYYLEKYNYSDDIVRVLTTNRRSNKVIVEATKYIADYKDYKAHEDNKDRMLHINKELDCEKEFYSLLLDPKKPINIIRYNDKGKSGKVNLFEADQIVDIIKSLWINIDVKYYFKNKFDYLSKLKVFLKKILGVVVVHNAQKVWIQNKLFDYFRKQVNDTDIDTIQALIISAVDTVDRYQGGEREVIIGCYGVSEKEIIQNEAEFLFDPNRINVMLSRAKSKFILIIPNEFLQFNPSKYEVLEYQRAILKLNEFCHRQRKILDYPWDDDKYGTIRYVGFDDIE
ncbi:DEAD/DEAH box helicase [Vallitalea sp.]|jgi:hypothetical protein|uniref:DEAD/DEAH box helicase n=1 Tax=Vallitalea sp. TaxID=1882829 RepID=UPI0025D0159E|nr:AAA domain-containing protein [Vallitalea sp.]MCT4686049.1 AAA domain-containing protein [Vallitalea sp.]